MHIFCIIYFQLYPTNFPLLKSFIIPRDEPLYSLSMSAIALRYQLSCRNSVHPVITSQLVTAKILLRRWNQMTIARRQIRVIHRNVRRFFNPYPANVENMVSS